MTHDIDRLFELRGQRAPRSEPAPGSPSDETLAAYVDGLLPPAQRRVVVNQILACPDSFEVVRAFVDAVGMRTTPAPFRVVGRLLQRGIELLNAFELTLRDPDQGRLVPALGALRRTDTGDGAVAELLHIRGPGSGLDELEVQMQTNGTARLVIRCDALPDLGAGEIPSVVFEVDGQPREKRPFTGEPVAFAPLGVGQFDIRLVAKAPGQPGRTLAEASVDLIG